MFRKTKEKSNINWGCWSVGKDAELLKVVRAGLIEVRPEPSL